MDVTITLMLRLNDDGPPTLDISERQHHSYSHYIHGIAATVAKEFPHQPPLATNICQAHPYATESEPSISRIVESPKAISRKQSSKIKKRHERNSLQRCTTIESTSAVKAEGRTRSFKGGWRRRHWEGPREKRDSKAKIKIIRTMEATGLSGGPEPSSQSCCQTQTAELANEAELVPSIVILTPEDKILIKDEPRVASQQECYASESSDLDQNEWEHAEISPEFDNLSLSDALQWDMLSNHGDTEMESCDDGILPVSEFECSDTSDMESDSYWEWNRERRQFQHWDEERQIYIYCPREFS